MVLKIMESNKHNNFFSITTKEYKKKWLSYEEQYLLLLQRGMSFVTSLTKASF